jgi:predicted phage-related endonuclease
MSQAITRGIGGSDIAAIVGLSSYKTPFDVYARITTGDTSKAGTRARLGNLAEPEILKDYCERNSFPLTAFERNVEISLPGKPHFRGELDALFRDNHGVECKLVGFRQADRWGMDGSDNIPDEYLCQVAWYAMLADLPHINIAAWFDGGGDYREFRYDRSPELEGSLAEKADKFWTDHVLAGVPPVPTGAKVESIQAVYPTANTNLRQATATEADLLAEGFAAYESAKNAEDELKDVKGRLQGCIGKDEGIYSTLGKVTWKNVKVSPKTDWEALAKSLNPPDELIKEYTSQPAGYRRFLFTPKKG